MRIDFRGALDYASTYGSGATGSTCGFAAQTKGSLPFRRLSASLALDRAAPAIRPTRERPVWLRSRCEHARRAHR